MEGSTESLRQILCTAPPNWQPPPGPPNPITVLHASLEHLRNTGDEQYLFLRTILEVLALNGYLGGNANSSPTHLTCEMEQLLFHCATGLRHVVLFRWDSYQPSLRACIRDFVLAVGLGLTCNASDSVRLPRTVSMACLSCASSFWKRGWTEDGDSDSRVTNEQQSYLESLIGNVQPDLQRFVSNQDETQQLFAFVNTLLARPFEQQPSIDLQSRQYTGSMTASFLSLLIGEFSGGNSSARYNLPIEFHRLCHHLFESGSDDLSVSVNCNKSGLDSTLHASMAALSSLVGYVLGNASSGAVQFDECFLEMGSNIIDVTCDVLSWEFGASAGKWDFASGSSRRGCYSVLLRPPQRWRDTLINPEFLGAMFSCHKSVRVGRDGDQPRILVEKRGRMAHVLRQLLLQLSSVASGPVFSDENERAAYSGFLLDGCLNALESILNDEHQHGQLVEGSVVADLLSAEIVDLVTILSRLTSNFKIKVMSTLPSFSRYLNALCHMGKWLLETSFAECQRVEGDIEMMEGVYWKNDALSHVLQCSDANADDYWLVSGTGGEEAMQASRALALMLAPLYGPYCMCRVRMSSLEEHFITKEGGDLDEIREEISAFGMEEEMNSGASLGRLDVLSSIKTLSEMFQQCMPRLTALFDEAGMGGDMTPEIAALLEEARMLILCAGHLLTDDCSGETPDVPESIINASKPGMPNSDTCLASIASLVDLLRSMAEKQATLMARFPGDPRLSPLLAKTILWFFRRFGPAYILPSSDEYRENKGGILAAYSTPGTAQPLVDFCTSLCLMYFCHLPQEKEVHDETTALLKAMAKKPFVRQLLMGCSSFDKIVALSSATSCLRHNASASEVATSMKTVSDDLTLDVVTGYQRLPYSDRARILTCIIIACSDMQNDKSNIMLTGCLKAVEMSFSNLCQALREKKAHSSNINVQESACLSIFLYGGIVLASEMSEPERIPLFITPSLPHLSGLMTFYAEDLTICEGLLKLFRDYAEQYIDMLTREQCIELFTASASMLKLYSEHHCKNRDISKPSEALEDFEEEKNYSDVMSAIQLLIHLGTKDFTNLCNTQTRSSQGIKTGQITDVIFFGLQQIIPLMTQGLLQFPTLCQHYFTLVGFMVETYPEKLCALPFELFNSLVESLLFGMAHSDQMVSKSSLQGISSLAKEHLKTHALGTHLTTNPDIFDVCTRRLIREVIFQPIIWDRLEPAGSALLPLAAINVQGFINIVNNFSRQLSEAKQGRLISAFEQLIKPDVLSHVVTEGREGRVRRVEFKSDFEMFVRETQSFLVVS